MFGFSKGEQGLSYSETAQRLEINSHSRIKDWERVYLTEGPEGFQIERRGRGSNGRPVECVENMRVGVLEHMHRNSELSAKHLEAS